ncbi:uncharacterized protein in LEU2 3'region-like [Dendronephthya gigantea]|uniref:uncharacterized protein in LEU2 3'region-like n=1 Tax=Dendronephthya gigantea TaxID=151771 RepID=UPI00106A44F0|nr:uncharacterized protein in LEU2 3'region-like [Dendronephthya gigantea]
MTSTIIFKSRKDYNEEYFIGCLSPNKEATTPIVTFNSSGMTPRKCKMFCQEHGHSVALLKHGAQCFCSEYSHIVSWEENKSSCSIPCTGEEQMFCGGKETYSSYRIVPDLNNLAWQTDAETSGANESGRQIIIDYRRKSRKERPPSLPSIKDTSYSLQTPTINTESLVIPIKTRSTSSMNRNATRAPVTLVSIAEEPSKTLKMDSGIYAEIPMTSFNHSLKECQPENEPNANTDAVHNRMNSSGNETYDCTVDNLLNPECLYIEVLP